MIRNINAIDWPAFCQRINENLVSARVKVQTTASNGVKSELAANASLQSMIFDGSDGCNDTITVLLKDVHEISHEIVEPVQIRLRSSGGSSDFNTIEIEAENGITIITLSPSIHPKVLDGLKLS
jgi:hypothetical protein